MESYERLRIDESGKGQRFGRLTVVGPWFSVPAGRRLERRPQAVCECDCGNLIVSFKKDLKQGNTKSCGCYRRDATKKRNIANTKHGELKGDTETPEHRVWRSLFQRCENENCSGYSRYGGRGIKICQRWRESFGAFLDDVGRRPSDEHSLDRIDNDGDYEPGNVRWATAKQQGRNKSNNKILTFEGVTASVSEWADMTGIRYGVLKQRLDAGWSTRRTLTQKVRTTKRTRFVYDRAN